MDPGGWGVAVEAGSCSRLQGDVKFLTPKRKRGGPVRRYPYTAIDDATRLRAPKIYKRPTQANAIDFIH